MDSFGIQLQFDITAVVRWEEEGRNNRERERGRVKKHSPTRQNSAGGNGCNFGHTHRVCQQQELICIKNVFLCLFCFSNLRCLEISSEVSHVQGNGGRTQGRQSDDRLVGIQTNEYRSHVDIMANTPLSHSAWLFIHSLLQWSESWITYVEPKNSFLFQSARFCMVLYGNSKEVSSSS